jgi:hypothetical protein
VRVGSNGVSSSPEYPRLAKGSTAATQDGIRKSRTKVGFVFPAEGELAAGIDFTNAIRSAIC